MGRLNRMSDQEDSDSFTSHTLHTRRAVRDIREGLEKLRAKTASEDVNAFASIMIGHGGNHNKYIQECTCKMMVHHGTPITPQKTQSITVEILAQQYGLRMEHTNSKSNFAYKMSHASFEVWTIRILQMFLPNGVLRFVIQLTVHLLTTLD